jgi:hypothetical protein
MKEMGFDLLRIFWMLFSIKRKEGTLGRGWIHDPREEKA